MWCMKCNNDLANCTCDDLQERLEKLADSPNLSIQWCARCNKHHSRCKCESPIWTTLDKYKKGNYIKEK